MESKTNRQNEDETAWVSGEEGTKLNKKHKISAVSSVFTPQANSKAYKFSQPTKSMTSSGLNGLTTGNQKETIEDLLKRLEMNDHHFVHQPSKAPEQKIYLNWYKKPEKEETAAMKPHVFSTKSYLQKLREDLKVIDEQLKEKPITHQFQNPLRVFRNPVPLNNF